MGELDTRRLYKLLETAADERGIHVYDTAPELLEASGCSDMSDFVDKLWQTCRAIRGEYRRRRTFLEFLADMPIPPSQQYIAVMAAMFMLDQIPGEEQPVKNPTHRERCIRDAYPTVRPYEVRRVWKDGLHLLVDNFEVSTAMAETH